MRRKVGRRHHIHSLDMFPFFLFSLRLWQFLSMFALPSFTLCLFCSCFLFPPLSPGDEILKMLWSVPGNEVCADCNRPDPGQSKERDEKETRQKQNSKTPPIHQRIQWMDGGMDR